MKFYFDYISPYAYLAWTQLSTIEKTYAVSFTPVPVLFAGLLNAHGQKGPAEIESKRRWMVYNAMRTAADLNVVMNAPAYHPFNPLLPLRLTTAVEDPTLQRQLIDLCFQAIWVKQKHISEAGIFAQELEATDFDPKLLNLCNQQTVKDRVKNDTLNAVKAGVFGVPTWIVDQQLFWGVDDIPHLERALADKDSIDYTQAEHWINHTPPSATRR